MNDPVTKGSELEQLPQPPTDGEPAPGEVTPEQAEEQPAEKWGGGSRDHKPDHKPPGKPPRPEPAWGGGGR